MSRVRVYALCLLTSGCSLDWKPATADGGRADASERDAGTPPDPDPREAGEPEDAQSPDDASEPDGGELTPEDGGEDAGADAEMSTACSDGTDVCTSDYPCFAANGTYTCRGQFPDWPFSLRDTHSTGFVPDSATNTVLDQSTGLVWTRSTGNDLTSYTQAVARCRALTAGGHDFRVPSLAEWSTVLNTRIVPDVDLTLFPDGVGAPYWTSSPSNPAKSDASGRFMYVVGGNTEGLLIYPESRAELRRVGCVRTAEARFSVPPSARLEVFDQHVHDRISGLFWHRASLPGDEQYAVAEAFCRNSDVAGRSWRIPTIAEQLTIADPTQPWFTVAPSVFTGLLRDIYWTSDVPVGGAGRHYALNFGWNDDRFDITQIEDANTMPCCPVRCVSSP